MKSIIVICLSHIFCSPCHGESSFSNTVLLRRGHARRSTSLKARRLHAFFFQICGRWTPRPQRNRGCTKCWQICTIRSSDTPVSDYCCFLTLIFHKVVCWHAVRLMYIFFQIYYRVCRWKNFEIRLTVSDGKSSVYLSDSRCSVNEMDLYNSLMFYTESWLFNQINSYNVHAIITLRLLS